MWEMGKRIKWFEHHEVTQISQHNLDLTGLVEDPSKFEFDQMTFDKPLTFELDLEQIK